MAKRILEFDEDERIDFELANNGMAFCSVIMEILSYLRTKVKYEDISEKEQDIYENLTRKIYEILDEREVSHLIE
jgi:hypothetical protein